MLLFACHSRVIFNAFDQRECFLFLEIIDILEFLLLRVYENLSFLNGI